MTIEEILASLRTEAQKIAFLKEKTINVPLWRGRFGLIQEFDPTKHPVMNKAKYPDIVTDSGIQEVTRVTCDLQRGISGLKRNRRSCASVQRRTIAS